VLVDDDAATIGLCLVLGDLRLWLRFGQARFDSDDLRSIAYAVGATFVTDHWGTTRTVVMHQEVDLADEGQGVLRLRLYPFHEIGITCSTFALYEEPAPPDEGRPGILRIAGDEETRESEQANGSGRFEA
jgi:hypothetical protein